MTVGCVKLAKPPGVTSKTPFTSADAQRSSYSTSPTIAFPAMLPSVIRASLDNVHAVDDPPYKPTVRATTGASATTLSSTLVVCVPSWCDCVPAC
jgi:hypothetical protein